MLFFQKKVREIRTLEHTLHEKVKALHKKLGDPKLCPEERSRIQTALAQLRRSSEEEFRRAIAAIGR